MQIYMVVHEYAIQPLVDNGDEDAIQVCKTIENIKKKHIYLEKTLEDLKSWSPHLLHPDLPFPSDNLEISIVGAFKEACCVYELKTLLKHGYNAKLYEPGCFSIPYNPDNKIIKEKEKKLIKSSS